MSRHQKVKKPHNTKTNHSLDLELEMNNDEFEFKYEGAKKQLTTLPVFEDKTIDGNFINEQNESTYTDAQGKFVMVDQVRYKNLLNKLNELQQEFAELNKTTEDGRSEYTVNNHYRKMQSDKALKAINELND